MLSTTLPRFCSPRTVLPLRIDDVNVLPLLLLRAPCCVIDGALWPSDAALRCATRLFDMRGDETGDETEADGAVRCSRLRSSSYCLRCVGFFSRNTSTVVLMACIHEILPCAPSNEHVLTTAVECRSNALATVALLITTGGGENRNACHESARACARRRTRGTASAPP